MSEERVDPDAGLVQKACNAPEGDFRAFEQLLEKHKEKILANCRYLTRSPDDAEDLAQEVFLKAFFAIARFEGRSSFRTWLHRIKVNHSLNFLKKKEGKSFMDLDDAQTASPEEMSVKPTAERKAVARGEREIIDRVLDSLTDTLRVPLIMRDMDQLPNQEIAEILGIGLSAVKMRIKRAREEFRQLYRTYSDAARAGALERE